MHVYLEACDNKAENHQLWIHTDGGTIALRDSMDNGWFLTGDHKGCRHDDVDWREFIPFYGKVVLEEYPS